MGNVPGSASFGSQLKPPDPNHPILTASRSILDIFQGTLTHQTLITFIYSSLYEAGRTGESDGHLVLELIRWKCVRGRGKSAVFCVTNLESMIRDICHCYCSSGRRRD